MRKPRYKTIGIGVARRLAKEHDKDQVVILAWDRATDTIQITTCGKSIEDSQQAGDAGNSIKRALGWPEELCHAVSARVKRAGRNPEVGLGPLNIGPTLRVSDNWDECP
jgi:hypothetical protein